jgi:Tol biopolymer transport system component
MVAVRTIRTSSRNTELFDLNRGVFERVTDDEMNASRPVWSPDGSQLAFSADVEGRRGIYVRSVGVDAPPRLLKRHQERSNVEDWSPDGAYLAYSAAAPDSPSQNALYLLPVVEGEEDPHFFAGGEARYGRAKFSPDGQWIAYVSNEDGRAEVYLREVLPGQTAGGRKHKVSRNGGWDPVWSPSGQEIYYQSFGGSSILSTAIRTDPVLELGEESVVLEGLQLPTVGWSFTARSFDIAPDGSRFLILLDTGGPESLQLVVVRNREDRRRRDGGGVSGA